MASPINVPLNAQLQNTQQLTQQVQAALNAVRLNLGGGSRALNSLSQPLGRLTGQADEFTKSLDAANARVLAFGASVGIVNAFSNAFKSLVASTIEVEKAIKAITVVGDQFNGKTKELSQGLFNVARATGQSFAEVSKAALEFSRQGQNVEETLKRTQDALILTRLTGLDAAKAVEGLTAAVNGFSKAGLNTTQILNKLVAVDQAFAVSSADLIEGFNRSAAVAENAGVTFDELAGIITSLQQQTSRGGAVIGNALKTIFTRLQDTSTLNQLQNLGVAVQDLEGNLLPARQILQNLAKDVEGLGQITRAGIFKDVAGTFQINQLISLVQDLNKENSIAADATRKAAGATNEAFAANEKLNQSLDAIINKVVITGKQLGALLGEIGLSDNLKGILDGINSFLEGASNLLQGEDLGSKFAKGIVKGVGAVLTGPGLLVFLSVIAKLTVDLVKFGAQSAKTFFGVGKAAREQQLVQEAIVQTLLRNQSVLNRILTAQGGQNAQAQAFLSILNQQEAALQNIRSLAGGIAAPLIGAGYGIGPQGGIQRRGRAAGGYLPAQEASDVRRGVGGASPSSKVVAIPNFAFGGGKRGTMIANTSEYIVPNYAGGGSAIFNQDMVKTMGLPAGAKKIGAAGGFIPNFARYVYDSDRIQPDKNVLLNAILKSTAKKNLIVGPAGSGKSTYAKSLGAFITNASQLSDAKEIDILSGAAKAKGGGFSKNFSQILEAVKDSGGQVSYLYANNLDILSRRSNRFLSGPEEGDLRSKKQLGGSRYAPLNQYDFLSQIKSASSNFQLIRGAGGFIPNFARTIKDVGSRYALITNDIRNEPRPITVNPEKDKDVAYQLFSYGIPTTQKVKSGSGGAFQDSRFTNSKLIEKYTELALNEANAYSMAIGGNALGPYEKQKVTQPGVVAGLVGSIFENGIAGVIKGARFKRAQAERKSNAIFDFFRQPSINKTFGIPKGVNYIEAKYTDASKGNLDSLANKIYNAESGSYQQPEKSLSQTERARLQALADKYQIGKSGKSRKEIKDARDIFKRTQDFQTIQAYGIKASARGYIPNFAASALQEAIAREKSAGLSSSQIYVDQSPALKSSSNPMGLMVANTRDEPAGGFQGIARARREGANPKLYGAANGFIPNYAPQIQNQSNTEPQVAKGVGDLAAKFIVLQGALTFFEGGFTDAGSAAQKVSQALQTLTSAFFAYQAIQQITTKAEVQQATQTVQSTSKLKIFTDKIKKFADDFAKGGGARASLVSRGGNLPSGTPFATRLSAGLGTSRAAQGVRNIVANPLSALKSIGAAAAAGAIALKGFNDLAALFYTRSTKLDSSLELLSSSAGKAAASLSEVDRASLKGATSGLRNISTGASFTKFLAGFSPLNLGKQQAAYNVGGTSIISNLKGGQTSEDFAKVQEDLSSLIFSNLRTQYKDAPTEYLKTQTQSELASLFSAATEANTLIKKGPGTLDLEKLLNLDSVQKLVKSASDTAIKIDRITAEAESKKPFAKLLTSIEDVIAKTNTVFNQEINRINDFSERIKAVQASKAFSNLNFEQQLSTNLLASTKEFENSFRQRQIDIIKNAQELIKSNLPQIVEGDRFNIGPETVEKIKNASSLDQVLTVLSEFQKELSTIDPTKTKSFVSQLNDFQNSVSTFNSNLQTRSATLKLEQEELIATTKAQIEFRDKFIEFSNSIGEAQRSLIGFRGQLERVDIRTESRINQRSAFATSRQEQLNIRREETLSGLSQRQGIEASANLQEALIEARKQSFTQENLVALNSNTEAIKELTKSLINSDIQQVEDEIASLESDLIKRLAETVQYGGISEQNLQIARSAPIEGPFGKTTLGERLDFLKGKNEINKTQLGYFSGASNLESSNVSAIAERVFDSKGPIGNIAQSATSLQEFIDKTTNAFGLNEQAALLLRPQLLNIYDSIKGQAATAAEAQLTEKARLDAAQELLDVTNNYKQSISSAALDLETRLATEPMSRGQFAATQRQYFIAKREKEMSDEQIREDRSSFSRGFEEALGPLEEKTLDFKNELGREIPQLFSQNLAQGLNDAISGAKSLKNALQDAALSFLNAISQKNIENLANMFTVGVGNFFAPQAKASGGMIKGGSGAKDDVPAMLMGGEYVIKKSAVKKYGSSFLDALNNGSIKGFAKGGGVQSGAGGFYVPGDYGEGSIRGKSNLLAFAGQSFTSGQYDTMGGFGLGGASVSLEAESARLTAFGRENSPLFERVQSAKDEAFQVYLQQLGQEKQYRDQLKQMEEAEKARKKQLTSAIVSAVASVALSGLGKAAGAGFKNAAGIAKAADKGLGGQFVAGLGGIFKGGNGQGGLGNLFSGNFSAAFNSGKNIYGGADNKQYIGYSLGNISYPYKRVAGGMTYGSQAAPGSAFTSEYNALPANIKSQLRDYGSDGYYRPYGRANGGMIYGGSGVRDDVPAMLTGGEFVLNNRATRKLGVQNLSRLNAGETTGGEDRSGAITESLLSKLDELIQATRESAGENVVVNVNSSEASGENQNAQGSEKELHKKIRQAVLDVIAQEKRLGGSLSDKNR